MIMSVLRRRHWFSLSSLAVVIAVASTDWPWGIWASFWRDHSMFTSLASGVLLLVFAAFGIDALIRVRDNSRWSALSHLALRDLAQVCQDCAVLMEWLIGNDDGKESTLFSDEVRQEIKSATQAFAQLSFEDRFEVATASESWVSLAKRLLQIQKVGSRRVIANWAPTVSFSREALDQMNSVVAIIDEMSEILLHLHSSGLRRNSISRAASISLNPYSHIENELLRSQWVKVVDNAWFVRIELRRNAKRNVMPDAI